MQNKTDCNNSSPQHILNEVHENFEVSLKGLNNWNNHRLFLTLSLSLTTGDVIELGSGDGSTNLLETFCNFSGRVFLSYDSNADWARKFCSTQHIEDWDSSDIWQHCDLLFVDHAPGEHRKVAVERMKDKAQIIVVHDTEIGGAGDYQLEPVLSTFRYRLNYNKTGGGAGATMVSNTIDVNRFRGLSLGPYKFDDD